MSATIDPLKLSCPIPISQYPHVLLAHGGGGRLMRDLIQKMFLAAFANLDENKKENNEHDSAVFAMPNHGAGRMAFTTDSYVIQPLFFPGGDIGELAVYGTVNDLAMSGARPLYLSLGLIIEEGLSMESLWRVVVSLRKAADLCGVQIVTGDTKVVERGKGDGIFINTAGVGVLEHDLIIRPDQLQVGDAILLSGDIGRHGMAIMAAREGLSFESNLESDCAPLAQTVLTLIDAGLSLHCLRDLTRGGLASALVEIATSSGRHLHIDERLISVHEQVRGACEMLGLDPLHVACEGRFIAFLPADQAELALSLMGEGAAQIGAVTADDDSRVSLKSVIGVNRRVDMLSGEQLPRIC